MEERENNLTNPERKSPNVNYSALVARAKSGDQEAYTALYEATNQELYRTIRAMVRTEDQALDIQQDAYIYAFTHLDQLGEPAKFSAWLHTIAVNRTRSVLRKQTALLFSELETEEGSGLPELADESPDNSPELALERKETAELIREILDGLSAGQRLLVGMYYYEQIPLQEIAEDLGVSPGTVKTQLFRSRKKIEAAVERLEKKGVKLFGLAPMPFLLALLKRAEPAAEEAEKAVLAGSLSKAGIAAETAAVHLGRSFFQTALGRAALGVITAAVIGGGVWGYTWVRAHLMSPLGDVRPTETVERAEDLTTESVSTEPAEPDRTEPETTKPAEPDRTEPETTEHSEPDTTEAESTEPATRPTGPEGSGANPGPSSQPTSPKSTDPPQPSDSTPASNPTSAPTEVLGWSWADGNSSGSMDWTYDYELYSHRVRGLVVSVKGESLPEIKTDRPDLIQIEYWGIYHPTTDTPLVYPDGHSDYRWTIDPIGVGTAHVSCVLNGRTLYTLTVTTPEPPSSFDSASVTRHALEWWQSSPKYYLNDCYAGMSFDVSAVVNGNTAPVITTDNPAVVRLSQMWEYECGGSWYSNGYAITAQIVSAGDANILVMLNGETVKSFPVHSSEYEVNLNDSMEDLLPYDAAPQVMAWDVTGPNYPITISVGNSQDLYVKMAGNELPTLYTDDPSVIWISPDPTHSSRQANRREYWYLIKGLEAGNCTLYCEFHGQTAFSVPVLVH